MIQPCKCADVNKIHIAQCLVWTFCVPRPDLLAWPWSGSGEALFRSISSPPEPCCVCASSPAQQPLTSPWLGLFPKIRLYMNIHKQNGTPRLWKLSKTYLHLILKEPPSHLLQRACYPLSAPQKDPTETFLKKKTHTPSNLPSPHLLQKHPPMPPGPSHPFPNRWARQDQTNSVGDYLAEWWIMDDHLPSGSPPQQHLSIGLGIKPFTGLPAWQTGCLASPGDLHGESNIGKVWTHYESWISGAGPLVIIQIK